MRLLNLTATAPATGNRIDLSWSNPDPANFPTVRVVRRSGSYPRGPSDGTAVAAGTDRATVTDLGLHGGRVCYYALFPFKTTVPGDPPDPGNLISATPVEPYGFAARIYGLLPAIYRRYDAEHEQLRRFLDLPGGELDRLYSQAASALDLADPELTDGRLLPLLAQWIGWTTDYTLPVSAQRAEIRAAPARYRRTGTPAAAEMTVARITPWAAQVKEFLHQVARTNRPERLNLWSRVRSPGGQWSDGAIASCNQAYDGRPAGVAEAPGTARVFYHTLRERGTEIWTKLWTPDGWQASAPVVARDAGDRHPAAAFQGNRLWLFWQDAQARLWSMTRTGDTWSAPLAGEPGTRPAAASDGAGVWLFWLDSGRIQFRRHDGTAWTPGPAGAVPVSADVPAHDDLFVVVRDTAPRLCVLWAGRTAGRWGIGLITKQGLDPAAGDWSVPAALPKAAAGDHDRHPAALATSTGIELFWSTTRHGGWSLDRAALAGMPPAVSGAATLAAGPYTQRGPLPVKLADGTVLLVSRSNEGGPDHRGAGSTTVDTRATAKLALHGGFADFQARTPGPRVARDAVGVFLTPAAGAPPGQVTEVSIRLSDALTEVLPVTCRPLIIT